MHVRVQYVCVCVLIRRCRVFILNIQMWSFYSHPVLSMLSFSSFFSLFCGAAAVPVHRYDHLCSPTWISISEQNSLLVLSFRIFRETVSLHICSFHFFSMHNRLYKAPYSLFSTWTYKAVFPPSTCRAAFLNAEPGSFFHFFSRETPKVNYNLFLIAIENTPVINISVVINAFRPAVCSIWYTYPLLEGRTEFSQKTCFIKKKSICQLRCGLCSILQAPGCRPPLRVRTSSNHLFGQKQNPSLFN